MTAWIPIAERMPTPGDADIQGCALAWHSYQGAMVMHISNIVNYGTYITHWMPTPAAPME